MKLFLKIIFKEFYHLFRSGRSRAFLWLVFRIGDKKRYKTQEVKFLKYRFVVPDALSFIWQVKEIFVDESYRFNANTPQVLIYVCGANIGVDCVYFKENYPQASIKAFEADPHIAEVLQKNLTKNKIEGVEVNAKAVWINNEGIEISLEGADGASIYGKENLTKVASVSLKELLAQESKVDMLKMDIEGAEVAVLEDCQTELHKVENLFVEYHAYIGQKQTLDTLLSILQKAGFRYHVQEVLNRKSPLANHQYRNNTVMDLQLNIYGYRL